MTRKILKPKVLGVLIASIAVGIFFGVPSIPMTVSAAEEVPDWFRGVAGFWADEDITTAEFIDGIEFLIEEEIIQVPGFIQAANAETVNQATISDLWTAINNMQAQLNTIQTSGGTPGPEGPAGAEGPQGPKGDSGVINTYVRVNSVNIGNSESATNIVVECDAGDVALGGGGIGGGPERKLGGSYPDDPNTIQDGDIPTSWGAYILNPDLVTGLGSAYVICADITP